MRALLDREPMLRHETSDKSEAELLALLNIGQPTGEGLFFPDTYRFAPGSSDLEVFRYAAGLMQEKLAALWLERAADLPLADPYQALILASVVEKETGDPRDRVMVAAVLINRLRIGMPLQSDPTVIYGLGRNFDGNLTRAHLRSDGPFNTYTRRGLPPAPISLPGLASLHAVLHPARSDALYFVARGDGSSEFSKTLAEHNRAVARYQKRRGARER